MIRARSSVFVLTLGCAIASCRARGPVSRENAAATGTTARPPNGDAGGAPLRVSSSDLEPGTLRAFGLLMPVGTVEQFSSDSTKAFYVSATLPRVMRYLERRLDIPNAEIHPLGCMIRNAHVRTTPDGESRFVDIGIREEGDRTLVTVWNRSALPMPPRTPEEGLRAAGIDPSTGRPMPENNN